MAADRLKRATTELNVVELAQGQLAGREQPKKWNRMLVLETRSVDE